MTTPSFAGWAARCGPPVLAVLADVLAVEIHLLWLMAGRRALPDRPAAARSRPYPEGEIP